MVTDSDRVSLTVAISTHAGYARFLPTAVASALRHADEVLVYSDGPCDSPIPAIELPYTGYCIEARRAAIRDASCDYLVHLDADDWLISRPPESGDLAFADMLLCDEGGAIRERWDYSQLPRTREAAFEFMRSRIGTTHGRNPIPGKCSFRVEWLRSNGLGWYQWPSTTFGEDVRTMIEYLLREPEIAYTSSPYYVYRMHGEQDTKDTARRDTFMADIDAYLQGDGCTSTLMP